MQATEEGLNWCLQDPLMNSLLAGRSCTGSVLCCGGQSWPVITDDIQQMGVHLDCAHMLYSLETTWEMGDAW